MREVIFRGKSVLLLFTCVILIFFLCACGNNITSGEVYAKEHLEGYTTVMICPVVVSNGQTSTTYMIPYTIYYPERWVVFIKDFDGEKWIKEDFYVSKEVFDGIRIGDQFEYNKDRGDLKDEPYIKEKQQESEVTE